MRATSSGVEAQHAVEPQHVRHQVVGEQGQLGEVAEAAEVVGQRVREVRDRELRALQERHELAVVARDVAPERHREQPAHERGRRAARLLDEAGERAGGALLHALAQLAQRARVAAPRARDRRLPAGAGRGAPRRRARRSRAASRARDASLALEALAQPVSIVR